MSTLINEFNKPVGEIYKKFYWIFPKVLKNITRGSVSKKTEWIITVELFCNKENIEILEKYFNNNTLQDSKYTACYYTISNDIGGKPTKSASTIIETGKNLGKKNQTNVFCQALMEARSKYIKKLENAENSDIEKTSTVLYAPMLLHIYKQGDINFKKSKEIYFIQPKLNGLRAIYNNGRLWSRTKKIFPEKDYILDELDIMMKNIYYISGIEIDNTKLYIDGELYIHGMNLEEINSITRSSAVSKKKIEYHIFDLFYPTVSEVPFVDRLVLLNTIFQTTNKYNYLKLVDTIQIHSEKELLDYYKYYVKKEKYEGLVLRKGSGLYSLTGSRSHDVLKIKERVDEDVPLINYTSGKSGKDKDAIIFIVDAGITGYKERLSEKELNPLLTGKNLNVVPNWSLDKRYELYKKLETDKKLFKKLYYGAPVRIEFFEYSSKGIPLQAKVLEIFI